MSRYNVSLVESTEEQAEVCAIRSLSNLRSNIQSSCFVVPGGSSPVCRRGDRKMIDRMNTFPVVHPSLSLNSRQTY